MGGEDSIQRLFECSHRNKDVYEKIARDMEAAGYTRSQKQISSKLKKLKYEYRRTKDDYNQEIVESSDSRHSNVLSNRSRDSYNKKRALRLSLLKVWEFEDIEASERLSWMQCKRAPEQLPEQFSELFQETVPSVNEV